MRNVRPTMFRSHHQASISTEELVRAPNAGAGCFVAIAAFSCAAFFGLVWSQTAEETLANAEVSEPLALMGAAIQLNRSGSKDESVFWFYAGQLRARYSPQLKGENSQLVLIFTAAGEAINAHAQ